MLLFNSQKLKLETSVEVDIREKLKEVPLDKSIYRSFIPLLLALLPRLRMAFLTSFG